MIPIVVVYPDGRSEERESMTFAEAQKAVDGYVEALHDGLGGYVLVNEEGRIRGMPTNPEGTVRALARGLQVSRPLVGPVVLVPRERVHEVLGGSE